ncbi:MAG: trimethyllysine dioxygenase [Alphaproteobacteria bacterium]|nr:trimethyllysine dioxygenase [Alphaproteobacteria bacterium]
MTQAGPVAIAAAAVLDDGAIVEVRFSDGRARRFPSLWLRDHCETPDCLHPETQQRLVDVFAFDAPVLAAGAGPAEGGRTLRVVWRSEDHESRLSADLLAGVDDGGAPETARSLWPDAAFPDGLPTVPYAAVRAGDAGMLDWLETVERVGFCLVDGVPPTPDATRDLAERIAYLRQTIFGDFWDAAANMEHADTAYTPLAITPHTDSTYSIDAPGLQMFHVIEFDGEGGESVLVDAFAIAEDVRRDHPEAFAALSTIPVPARYLEDGVHLEARRPVIRLDAAGRVEQVSFNHHDRAPFLLPEAEQRAFYDAYGLFHRMASEPARQLVFGLRPGGVLLFDNWRTLHGRLAYSGRRRLCGAYHNREDFESRLRTLRRSQARKAA